MSLKSLTTKHKVQERRTKGYGTESLLTLDLREQAALQAALVTHAAPDALVTLALTGACRIGSLQEARQLRKWLSEGGPRVTPISLCFRSSKRLSSTLVCDSNEQGNRTWLWFFFH